MAYKTTIKITLKKNIVSLFIPLIKLYDARLKNKRYGIRGKIGIEIIQITFQKNGLSLKKTHLPEQIEGNNM